MSRKLIKKSTMVSTLVLDEFNDHPLLKDSNGKLFILNRTLYFIDEVLYELDNSLTLDNIGDPYRGFVSVGQRCNIDYSDTIVLIKYCEVNNIVLNISPGVLSKIKYI